MSSHEICKNIVPQKFGAYTLLGLMGWKKICSSMDEENSGVTFNATQIEMLAFGSVTFFPTSQILNLNREI